MMTNRDALLQKVKERVCATGLSHIAFIMDGNGRWATKQGLPREAGHRAGAETFKKVVRLCSDVGIGAVTVYAFSTENWKRPGREVSAIMHLLDSFIKDARDENEKNNIRYVFLGDKTGLASELARKCEDLEALTKNNEHLLNIALNYGGRAELVSACNRLIRSGKTEVTEEDVAAALYTAHCADPDLIVRTAGEYRLSNFLLWQSAYSEFYFSDTLWPDYTLNDLAAAVESFSGRRRRFGAVL